MALSVKDLIDKYSKIQENESDGSPYNFKLEGELSQFEEAEQRVLAALNMGVVVEKVLTKRRESRNEL